MWKFELKRVLIKKKGLIIIAAALLLELLTLRHSYSYRVDSEVEDNKELYMTYMEKYGGIADEEKYSELVAEIEELEENIENAKSASDKCFAGEITRAQMSELIRKGVPCYDDLEVLKSIRVQYNYAMQNGKSGAVMYENGWILLLGRQYSSIIIPVAIILIIMSMFTEDYAYDMYRINDCCKNGKNRLFFNRITAAVIVGVILCIGIMAVDYLYFDIKYGLYNPLENVLSVSGLKDVPVHFSLIVNYLLTGVQMLFGSIIIIIITAFLGQLLKNKFYGVMSVILLYMFPYIFLEREQWVKYMLPISFFTDGGYVNGFETLDESRLVLDGVALIKRMVILIFVLSIILIMTVFDNRKKKNVGLLLTLFICIAMSGCGQTDPWEDIYWVSSAGNPGAHAAGDKLILMDNDGRYYIYIDDKKIPLHDDPFYLNSDSFILAVTVSGQNVYYQVDENNAGNQYIKFYELDTNTMERKMIFKKDNFVYSNDSYLDLKKIMANATDTFNVIYLEFVSDDYIIYSNFPDIILYNRNTGKEKKILERAGNFSIYQEKLYYTNELGYIMSYDFKTEKSSSVLEELVNQYYVCGKDIVYIDSISLNVKLYNSDTGNITAIIEDEVEKIEVQGNDVYYSNYNDELLVYNMETNTTRKIADNVHIYSVLENGKQIMYKDYDMNDYWYDFSIEDK